MNDAKRLLNELNEGTAEKDWPAWAAEASAFLMPHCAPSGKRERMAFYAEAMRDPKNHGALALELAYLREKVDSGFVAPVPGPSSVLDAWQDTGSDLSSDEIALILAVPQRHVLQFAARLAAGVDAVRLLTLARDALRQCQANMSMGNTWHVAADAIMQIDSATRDATRAATPSPEGFGKVDLTPPPLGATRSAKATRPSDVVSGIAPQNSES